VSERKRGKGCVKAALRTDKSLNRQDVQGASSTWRGPFDKGELPPGGNERGSDIPDRLPGGKHCRAGGMGLSFPAAFLDRLISLSRS